MIDIQCAVKGNTTLRSFQQCDTECCTMQSSSDRNDGLR